MRSNEQSSATEFCVHLCGELERAFRDEFGDRWTPEENGLFQDFQATVLAVAGRLDGTTPDAPATVKRVLLSNYGERRR